MADQNGGEQELERSIRAPGLFATAYGNVGSSIYYALGLVAAYALGLTPVAFMLAGLLFCLTALTYAEGATMFPEAGGSSNFARHAFNEFASFFAGWSLSLDYVITIAISAFFVPHYLGVFWEPLRGNPWDVVGGVALVVVLCAVNIWGVKESAALNIFLAVADLITQVLLVVLGVVLIFNPEILVANVDLGVAPTWGNFVYGLTLATIAYTGIETVSNLAEESKDPGREVPRAALGIIATVLTVYLGITVIAMMAMPVYEAADGSYTTSLATEYSQDPVLGIVDNLPLSYLVTPLKFFVGILAATILIIATNAGIIGISRLSYSLADHRQLPSAIGRLHSRFQTPFVAIAIFGLIAAVVLIPGQTDFLADIYAFGAMLSFTMAHVSILVLRWRRPEMERPFKVPLSLRLRGREVPVLVILGALGTFAAWATVTIAHPAARIVGPVWMVVGIAGYVLYRRRQGLSLTETVEREPGPLEDVPEVEYASVLVPVTGSPISEEMIAVAARLAPGQDDVEDGLIHALYVVEVPRNRPVSAVTPGQSEQAQAALDEAHRIGEEYGMEVQGYTRGARDAGQTIVEEAERLGVEVVILGASRKRRLGRRVISPSVDYVLENAPCRVIVVEEAKARTRS